MNFVELGGLTKTMLKLPVKPDAREALAEAGLTPEEVPEAILLHVRQASGRERERFEASQKRMAKDQNGWVADLIRRRAVEGTDPRVIAEVARDLTPTEITQLTYAFMQGEVIEDPKALEGVALMVQRQMTMSSQALLNVLAQAAHLPSSPTSTASAPGNSGG